MGQSGKERRCVRSRVALLVCLFAVTAISASVTPAAVSSSSAKFDATLVGPTTGGFGWCCGSSVDFEGAGVVMAVGAVEFTGQRQSGCLNPLILNPTPCFRTLDLLLVARNGDRLAIRGDDVWLFPADPPPLVTTWSVDQANSTGRFADFAADGTYTFEFLDAGVRLTLSGHRR